ncbi:hypothetical protein KEM48_009487 [Puccinia striiformis f. sp. tritici PST-130]|nr:hypothetical protein KEM48_009487 [Puccinia striiformis f. sp. tritici PST-130]
MPMVIFPRRQGGKALLLCALQAFCCISKTGSSLTTASGHLGACAADDLVTEHRISKDDLTIREFMSDFPLLAHPPTRMTKKGETNSPKKFNSIGEKTREINALDLDFRSLRNEIDGLRKEKEEEIGGQLARELDAGKPKALIQKIEELTTIHTRLLRDTIRAKVTELCSMRPHRTMTEIGKFGRELYELPLYEVKQSILKSHMEDLNVLLHQVGSFQTKDGNDLVDLTSLQIQELIFKTVDYLYKYDMIPASMVREFFAIDRTLEVAIYNMVQSFSRRHDYLEKFNDFQKSDLILDDPSLLHFWDLFHALEVKEQRRSDWLTLELLLKRYHANELESDRDLSELILGKDGSFCEVLEAHVGILIENQTTGLNEESPYVKKINENIGILLKKSFTITDHNTTLDNDILKITSMILHLIIKDYEDYNLDYESYDIMGFNKRGSSNKEAFNLRYASLDLIEELVRIENHLCGFYDADINGLELRLDGKTKSELASQIGLIDSYIKITSDKHLNLISKLWDTDPIFHSYNQRCSTAAPDFRIL